MERHQERPDQGHGDVNDASRGDFGAGGAGGTQEGASQRGDIGPEEATRSEFGAGGDGGTGDRGQGDRTDFPATDRPERRSPSGQGGTTGQMRSDEMQRSRSEQVGQERTTRSDPDR